MNKLPLPDFLKSASGIPIIDVRSEDEYRQGHIPGSINIPILKNEQRAIVGTVYKQEGQQKAVLKGFQLAGPEFEQKAVAMLARAADQQILIHCWRGGMRSEIMAWIAKLSGLKVSILEGGYKTFRHHVLEIIAQPIKGVLISGPTGSGKTEILKVLADQGYPVIDLEEAAQHRGSSFGAIGKMFRTQEMFENVLAAECMKWPTGTQFLIEDESRMIGTKCIPEIIFRSMQLMPMISLEVSTSERIDRIKEEYAKLDKIALKEAIQRIEKRLGNQRMKDAIEALNEDRHEMWISIMLGYYDKSYDHLKINRNSDKYNVSFEWQHSEKGLKAIKEILQKLH